MRILIDIGHPAHVHYFKNLIWEMQKKGHEFLLVARDRGPTIDLIKKYGFKFVSRGKGSATTLGKLMYMPKADLLVFKAGLKFRPDLFLSFGSIYAAHASKMLGKPHIAFDDTEFSTKEYKLYSPFTDVICTPKCFRRDWGKKQVRFNGYIELCYLHPNYFKPDRSVLEDLGVEDNEKYVVMRFVAFNAIHDGGVRGFSLANKIKLVDQLSKYAKVFITSENSLPKELEKYRFAIAPERLHDALYFASLYVGDSQTTSTEAALLGVPSVRCNTFACSDQERANFIDLAEYQLLKNINVRDQDKAIDLAEQLISVDHKPLWATRRDAMLDEKIDVTKYMVWFVENYPRSYHIMKEDPEYQRRFK